MLRDELTTRQDAAAQAFAGLPDRYHATCSNNISENVTGRDDKFSNIVDKTVGLSPRCISGALLLHEFQTSIFFKKTS